ncbi:MAG: hypothetical protein PVJ33_00460 [Lysobacterales bacterium]|jgi:hypothetical protein
MTLRASRIATLSTSAYALGQAGDLATTYWLSPILDRETNLIVERLGWGWPGMVSFAVAATVIMLLVQGWMWRRLARRLPGQPTKYGPLYQALLLGETQRAGAYPLATYTAGILMGVAFVVGYAAIVSKVLASTWNLSLWVGWTDYAHPMTVRVIKNVIAAMAGAFSFFVVPYWINHRADGLH